MSSIVNRLYQMARSEGIYYANVLREKLFGRTESFDADTASDSQPFSEYQNSANPEHPSWQPHRDIPTQVVEDLKLFNLTPPSSMEEVRKARNRELKQYHSDKFINHPEKFETSKKIMQIYNAAYDRLEAYYRGQR